MTPRERYRSRVDRLELLLLVSHRLALRFDRTMTLGELRATLAAQLGILRRERLTVTGIARRGEQPKSSVSRWIGQNPEFRLVDNPDDGRSKLVEPRVPSEELLRYLDEMIDQRFVNSADRHGGPEQST